MPDLPSFLVITGANAGLLHHKAAIELREIARQVRPELRERLLRVSNCIGAADYIALPEVAEAEPKYRLEGFVSPPRMMLINEEVAGEVVASDFPRLPEQSGGPVVPEAIKPENALDFACRLTEALKADKKARKAEKKKRIVDAIVGMW